jgi:hypothetical protein
MPHLAFARVPRTSMPRTDYQCPQVCYLSDSSFRFATVHIGGIDKAKVATEDTWRVEVVIDGRRLSNS